MMNESETTLMGRRGYDDVMYDENNRVLLVGTVKVLWVCA